MTKRRKQYDATSSFKLVASANATLREYLDDDCHVDRPAAGTEVKNCQVDYLTKVILKARDMDDKHRKLKVCSEQSFRSLLRAGALQEVMAALGQFLDEDSAWPSAAHNRNAKSGEAVRKPSRRLALITLKLDDTFRKHCDSGGDNFLSVLQPSLIKEVSYLWAFQKVKGMQCPAIVYEYIDAGCKKIEEVSDVHLYNSWLPQKNAM